MWPGLVAIGGSNSEEAVKSFLRADPLIVSIVGHGD